jgi:hypothetical protein
VRTSVNVATAWPADGAGDRRCTEIYGYAACSLARKVPRCPAQTATPKKCVRQRKEYWLRPALRMPAANEPPFVNPARCKLGIQARPRGTASPVAIARSSPESI